MKSLTSSIYLAAEVAPVDGVTLSVLPESVAFDESPDPQTRVIKVRVMDGTREVPYGGNDGFDAVKAGSSLPAGSHQFTRYVGVAALENYGCHAAFVLAIRPKWSGAGSVTVNVTYRGSVYSRDIAVDVRPSAVTYRLLPSMSILHFQRDLLNNVTGTNTLSVQVRKITSYRSSLLNTLPAPLTMGWSFDGGAVTYFDPASLAKSVTEKDAYGHRQMEIMLYESGNLIDKVTLPVVIDGLNGADGKPGSDGAQGIQGCILQITEWEAGVTYHNDTALKTNALRKLNYVTVQSDNGWKWKQYLCKITHLSATANKPGTVEGARYWAEIQEAQPMCLPAIFAEYARFRFTQTNQILMVRKENGQDVVYMGIGGKDYPMWAGGQSPTDANVNFRLDANGHTYQKGSHIEGDLYCVGPEGISTCIQGGSLAMYLPHSATPSLLTAIDTDGELVIRVYDKTGKFCYDLGPKGLPKIDNQSQRWTDIYMRKLQDTEPWKDVQNINHVIFGAADRRYLYHSATINGIPQNKENDQQIFVSRSTSNVLPDGWYNTSYSVGRPAYSEVPKGADGKYIIHPAAVGTYNPNDPVHAPLVQVYIRKYVGGRPDSETKAQLVYFNVNVPDAGGSASPDLEVIPPIIRPSLRPSY